MNDFLKKYLINTETFVKKFNTGVLGDEEDFFVWEGSLKIKNTLIEEQKLLSEIL